jgi:hypothetical protein
MLFFMAVSAVNAQPHRLDSLIVKLDDEKLVGTCNYVWVLKNGCKEADSLIKIGKTRNQNLSSLYLKLYSLLTDTGKGIIAHYVLSNILYADNITLGSIFYDDEAGTIEYDYNGLRFYENKYKRMFADESELDHNKKIWTVLFRKMKILQ